MYAVNRLTTTLDRNAPVESRFAPSFPVALCTLPLFRLTFFNSIIIATVAQDQADYVTCRRPPPLLRSAEW